LYGSGDEVEASSSAPESTTVATPDETSNNGDVAKEHTKSSPTDEPGLEPLQLVSVIGCRRDSDLSTLEKQLKRVFAETFKSIDEGFLTEARKAKPVWKDGTTVTCVLLLNDSLYVANLGDSKAIVCRSKEGGFSHIELTVNHNPTMYEERMRIQKAGGTVKDGRVDGIIEVSRSIGDGQFKTHGVTCIPDMKKLTITERDSSTYAAQRMHITSRYSKKAFPEPHVLNPHEDT
ncbi:protein phosphatase 2C, partial [Teladorsagia circumcincta]